MKRTIPLNRIALLLAATALGVLAAPALAQSAAATARAALISLRRAPGPTTVQHPRVDGNAMSSRSVIRCASSLSCAACTSTGTMNTAAITMSA